MHAISSVEHMVGLGLGDMYMYVSLLQDTAIHQNFLHKN